MFPRLFQLRRIVAQGRTRTRTRTLLGSRSQEIRGSLDLFVQSWAPLCSPWACYSACSPEGREEGSAGSASIAPSTAIFTPLVLSKVSRCLVSRDYFFSRVSKNSFFFFFEWMNLTIWFWKGFFKKKCYEINKIEGRGQF